jgi:hypothetical protein
MQLLAQSLQADSGAPTTDPPNGLCVLAEGFSLHAGVAIDEFDRDALERLAHYCPSRRSFHPSHPRRPPAKTSHQLHRRRPRSRSRSRPRSRLRS